MITVGKGSVGKRRPAGFTIVELLIVIVVIAILAALIIVAYNSVQRNAVISALQSELRQASQEVEIYKVDNNQYPGSQEDAFDVITPSSQNEFQYSYDGGSGQYCLTITTELYPTLAFYVQSPNNTVQEGVCSGHTLPGDEEEEEYPVATTVSCFGLDGTGTIINTYFNNENNDSGQPACPKNVVAPLNIIGIGPGAFYNKDIESIIVPATVSSIGPAAFNDNNITTFNWPSATTEIAAYAFYNNDLTSITIPNTVTTIADSAFQMNNLTAISLPSSVTTIGNSAFGENQLASLVLPNSVTSIGESAFYENSIASLTLSTSLTSIPSYAFNTNNLTSVVIPSSVTSIGDWAFRYNPLTSVTIPSSVASIGAYGFANAQDEASNFTLPSVSLPTGISIQGNTFDGSVSISYY